MKKIYTMINESDKYTIVDESNEEMMSILKKTLSIDGKKIYDVFYENYEDGDEIIINKDESSFLKSEKLDLAVYEKFTEIISSISSNINSIEKNNSEDVIDENLYDDINAI